MHLLAPEVLYSAMMKPGLHGGAPRIFVSSTAEDLKSCRKEVCELIRSLGLIDVAMERWPADPRPPLDVVQEALADSDVYLGILAWRYGSRLSDGGISYTEYEYDLASDLGKPRFLFLKHRTCPVLADDIDIDSTDIRRFRSKVENALLVHHFTNELELLRGVSASLFRSVAASETYRALSVGEQIILELRRLAREDILTRRHQLENFGIDSRRDWFIAGLARCNVGRFYVPRGGLMASVTKWLVRKQTPYLFVTGPSGSGKTNSILELIECVGRTPSPLAQRAVFVLPLGKYDPDSSFLNNVQTFLSGRQISASLSPAASDIGSRTAKFC
jgi:hypothetical protein